MAGRRRRTEQNGASDENGDESDINENGTASQPPAEMMSPGMSAADRFAALEQKLFKGLAARIDGKIERGHGSLFRRLPAEDQARYLALEKEVMAEAAVNAARAVLSAAEAALREAEARREALQEK